MTLIHEKGSELHWKDVRELVVGEQTIDAISTASIVYIKSICKTVFLAGSSVVVPMFSVYHSVNCFHAVAKR